MTNVVDPVTGEPVPSRLEERRKLIREDVGRMLMLGGKDAPRPVTREVKNFQQMVGYSFLVGTLLGGMSSVGRESARMASVNDQMTQHQTRSARLVRAFFRDGVILGARVSIVAGVLEGTATGLSLITDDLPIVACYAASGALTGSLYALVGRMGRLSLPFVGAVTVGGALIGAAAMLEESLDNAKTNSEA